MFGPQGFIGAVGRVKWLALVGVGSQALNPLGGQFFLWAVDELLQAALGKPNHTSYRFMLFIAFLLLTEVKRQRQRKKGWLKA